MGIVGAILGDIAGSPFEFQWDQGSINFRRYQKYDLFSEKCMATDDSFMSIATMHACLTDGNFERAYREYGLSYPASYGGKFGTWLYCPMMGPYNSFGNGSAMRVSFIGEHYPMEQVKEMATKSAEVTHNHEEGIKGAIVTATCIRMAEDGASKDDILNYGISQYSSKARNYPYRYGCDRPYKDYLDDTKMEESCMVSVPIAIRCFYESNSFEECMRMINSLVCDTDTIGAIAGAICESYYGNCLGSKEADLEMIKRYLPTELYEEVEKQKVGDIIAKKDKISNQRQFVTQNKGGIRKKRHNILSIFKFFKK